MSDQPQFPKIDTEAIAEAFKGFGKVMAKLGVNLVAQGAMGSAMNGDLEAMENALKALSAEDLKHVHMAAQAVAMTAYDLSEAE